MNHYICEDCWKVRSHQAWPGNDFKSIEVRPALCCHCDNLKNCLPTEFCSARWLNNKRACPANKNA